MPSADSAGASYSEDRRLRATVVLVIATVLEAGWLRLRVIPEFAEMFAQLGPLETLPKVTQLVLGGAPYLLAILLAGLALTLGVRGANRPGGQGTAAVVLAAITALSLGVGVIACLYLPLARISGAIQ